MPWRYPSRQRIDALGQQVDVVSGRLDETMVRLDRLSADYDRLSSAMEHARRRLDEEGSQRRQQMEQLSAVRGMIMELQGQSRATADLIGRLQEDGRTGVELIEGLRREQADAAGAAARHASTIDDLEGKRREQGEALDQLRADLTRVERQAAADLDELRSASVALARKVFGTTGGQRDTLP